METLLETYIPSYIEQITSFMGIFGAFFAGGILISFLLWAIGYSARALFGIVELASR